MPIICAQCGKNYTWQAKYASKKVRCKCGHVMTMPAADPDEVLPAPEPVEEDTFDFKDGGPSEAVAAPVFPPSMGVPVAAAAPAAAPRPAPMGSKADKYAAAEKQKVKTMIIGLVALVLVVGLAFAAFKLLGGSSTKSKTGNKGDDDVLSMIDDEPGYEMKKWAQDNINTRMVGGWTGRQVVARADQLYGMGAKKVYAFGAMMSLSFAIELPDDKDQRARIIDWANSSILQARPGDSKEIKDIGQRFLLLPAPT